MYYNRKKELLKSAFIIGFILLIAIVSTHYIYYKFKDNVNIDYNSKSLDITFHEKRGADISITKITPVTDSVGLSSKPYSFTIKNNLTEPVRYDIILKEDINKVIEDDCGEYLIDKEYIKIAIKEEKASTKIYTLDELENNILDSVKINALGEKKYTVRVWVSKDISLPQGTTLHYHGKIKVVEK